MNIISYFRRVTSREPLADSLEAQVMLKETKKYFGIVLALIVIFIATQDLLERIPVVGILSFILYMLLFFVAFYLGVVWYIIKKSMNRFKNLSCDHCGANLSLDLNNPWEEVEQRTSSNHNGTKLFVKIRFFCTCPNCGKEKQFVDELCGGQSDDTSTRVISTQELVWDYLQGRMHL